MKETEELLSQQPLSPDQVMRLAKIKDACDAMLRDLDALLTKCESLGTMRQRNLDRARLGMQDITGMRVRLGTNVSMLDAFNNAYVLSF